MNIVVQGKGGRGSRRDYCLSFSMMLQLNWDTGTERKIRRTAVDPQIEHCVTQIMRKVDRQDRRRLSKELSEGHRELQAAKESESKCKRKLAKKTKENEKLRRRNSDLCVRSLSSLPGAGSNEVCRALISQEEAEHLELLLMFEASMVSHRKSRQSDKWCAKPDVVVTGIEQIMNPFKQPSYEAARREVLGRNPNGCQPITGIAATKCKGALGSNGPNLNEYFLFHGTRYDTVDDILRNGLDPQRGGESVGAMFGRGLYFAENASKSDFYTTCELCSQTGVTSSLECKHPTATRCMLVA